jgi:STE24 endopeptidase
MLVKAARINKMDPQPPWWVEFEFSHPPIAERIAAIR